MLKAINNADLNIFKRDIFKMSKVNECPCGEKKATPLKDGLLKDTFECCGEKN